MYAIQMYFTLCDHSHEVLFFLLTFQTMPECLIRLRLCLNTKCISLATAIPILWFSISCFIWSPWSDREVGSALPSTEYKNRAIAIPLISTLHVIMCSLIFKMRSMEATRKSHLCVRSLQNCNLIMPQITHEHNCQTKNLGMNQEISESNSLLQKIVSEYIFLTFLVIFVFFLWWIPW